MRFYGREKEIAALKRVWDDVQTSRGARMVCIVGRPRVGKTTLIQKTFENEAAPVLSFLVQDRSEESLAAVWTQAVCRAFDVPFAPRFRRAADVIAFALSLTKDRPCLFILDECQRFTRRTPDFWAQLQSVWAQQSNDCRLLLVLSFSGSASSQPDLDVATAIHVKPFAPAVLRQIVTDENPAAATPLDLLTIFAMTGGVAGYVEILATHRALDRKSAVQHLFSEAGRWLRDEGAVFLASEYRAGSSDPREILHAVAQGASTWSAIEKQVGRDINGFMEKLEKHGLLTRERPLFAPSDSRQVRYRLADPFLAFWLTFIDPIEHQDLANNGQWDELIPRCDGELAAYLKEALADWLRAQLQASGVWSAVGRWWNRSTVIDIVAADAARRRLLLGTTATAPVPCHENDQRRLAAEFLQANPKFSDWAVECRGFSPDDM